MLQRDISSPAPGLCRDDFLVGGEARPHAAAKAAAECFGDLFIASTVRGAIGAVFPAWVLLTFSSLQCPKE
jgi:hypothetical protein